MRKLIPKSQVDLAAKEIVKLLQVEGFTTGRDNPLKIDPSNLAPNQENHLAKYTTLNSPEMMSRQDWIRENNPVKNVLEHENIRQLMQNLLENDNETGVATCLDFKWLRAVGSGLYTGLHADIFYVGHISTKMLTCWIPLIDISLQQGALVVAPGSHKGEDWKGVQDLYKDLKPASGDGTKSGWLTEDPNTIIPIVKQQDTNEPLFKSTDYQAGDVVILDLRTIHITATNQTDSWRLSCDTRWISL